MQSLIHSPPPSSEMDLSSILQQPAQSSESSESSVQDMVTKYRKTKVLNPIVSLLCDNFQNQEMLQNALKHDLSLIRGRSSRLEDHEINIAQKAFMLIMQNCKDRLGGIELYVQELIGLRHIDATQSMACVQTALNTRDTILRLSSQAGSSPAADDHTHEGQPQLEDFPQSRPQSSIGSNLTICNYPISNLASTTTTTATKNVHGERFPSPVSDSFAPQAHDQNTSSIAQQHSSSDANTSDPTDHKFQRLWSLFLEASAEFEVQTNDNFRRTTAAKFLRDTIENCLFYISTSPSSPSAGNHAEETAHRQKLLENTLKLAIEAAERGSNGRKRRFDLVASDHKFHKYVVGGKFVPRRGRWASDSRGAAHYGNEGKGDRHAVRY